MAAWIYPTLITFVCIELLFYRFNFSIIWFVFVFIFILKMKRTLVLVVLPVWKVEPKWRRPRRNTPVTSLVPFLEVLQVLIDKIKNIKYNFSLSYRFIHGENISLHFTRLCTVIDSKPSSACRTGSPGVKPTVLTDLFLIWLLCFFCLSWQCCPYSLVVTAMHSTSCMWRSTESEQRGAPTDLWTGLYLYSTSLPTAQRYRSRSCCMLLSAWNNLLIKSFILCNVKCCLQLLQMCCLCSRVLSGSCSRSLAVCSSWSWETTRAPYRSLDPSCPSSSDQRTHGWVLSPVTP